MRRITMMLIVAVVAAGLAAAAGEPKLEDPPGLKDLIPRKVLYRVPGMDRVRVTRDIVYKTTPADQMKMDVYSPRTKGVYPAVVFIHGGYIPPNLKTKPKDWGVFTSYGRLAAASGFVGVTFNHRYYSFAALPDAQSDVDDAIAYVRKNAQSLHVDPDRIVLWVFSGGGAFVSSAIREAPSYVRAIVSFYAVLDFTPLKAAGAPNLTDEEVANYSPALLLQKSTDFHAPVFIARAGKDSPPLNSGVDNFVAAANAKQVPGRLHVSPSGAARVRHPR